MPSVNDKIGSLHPAAMKGGRDFETGVPLPRSVRWLMRRFERFVLLARPLPSGAGSALAILFLCGGLLAGAFSGGHGPVVVSGAAKAVGLKATDIVISGQSETREADVFDALALGKTRSLVGFDVEDARKRVLELPWVNHVEIRKFYPGKLLVELQEKNAFAVWQQDSNLFVVEKNGKLITKFGIADLIDNRFAHLPHLVGKGAAESATDILPLVARYPKVAAKAKAYIRVADRRWDIAFSEGLTAQLPEYGIGNALARLARMDDTQDVLARQISNIDLRLKDRVTFRLQPEAAEERAKLVAARLKAMKKAERNL